MSSQRMRCGDGISMYGAVKVAAASDARLSQDDGEFLMASTEWAAQSPEAVESWLPESGSIQGMFEMVENAPAHVTVTHLARPDAELLGASYYYRSRAHAGHCRLVRLAPDLLILNTNMSLRQSTSSVQIGEDFIELHFRLSGQLSLYPDGGDAPAIDVGKGTLLLWRQPVGLNVRERIAPGEQESSVTIYLRPSTLTRYLGDYSADLPESVRAGLSENGTTLFFLRMTCYPRLIEIVRELWALDVASGRGLVRADGLVTIILCEVFAMLEGAHDDSISPCRLSDADVRCLRRACNHIRSHFTPPPTIAELADLAGLSATKLKNGFKALFGKSTLQYANDLRMQHALDLLRKSDVPIVRVAEMLGYEYQSSFTAAFRRRFDVLPKDYRRDPMILAHKVPFDDGVEFG